MLRLVKCGEIKSLAQPTGPFQGPKVRLISVPRSTMRLRAEVVHLSAKALGNVPMYLGRLYEVACMKSSLQRGTGKCGVWYFVGNIVDWL